MTPDEVKKAHDEIWAKREKIKGFNGITILYLDTRGEWLIDISNHYFIDISQVRTFLDGLE